ncbi:MAG: 4Fe-4S binding protein [Geobacteraceae bacterium]
MKEQKMSKRIGMLRTYIQWGFFAWVVVIGVRFGVFVRHFESDGMTLFVNRPPGVDGFLPIGALASLKSWLATGVLNPLHPAAVVIFLSIVGMSLLAKKSFCSWLCPVGTLSDAAGKTGRLLLGRNFRVWRPLDLVLRGVKYLLLLFFIKIILIDMPSQALALFLETPYWAISDVKMLYFFTRMSSVALVVLGILAGLSVLYEGFWCRYLCPYGALLGLASLVSPFKVRRDPSRCTGCRSCTAACPARLPVHDRQTIRSAECNGCLSCTSACPEKDVLRMGLFQWKRPFPVWLFPAVAVFIFAAGIGAGIATDTWQSSLGYADYQYLIPLAPFLSH